MRTAVRRTALLASTAALVAAAATAPAASATDGDHPRPDSGLHAVGLADGGTDLVSLRTDRPHEAHVYAEVTGLSDGDASLVGIDFRVQNERLYGVGDQGGVYLIDERTGSATKVGQLSVPLEGESFGVDFNPAANALRVTSDAGQNLRQPFAGGDGTTASPAPSTVVDGTLTNPAVAPATGRVTATGVAGSAYTNNDLDADTATTLYALDTALDQVDLQSPANDGTLAATGKLLVDIGPDAGFDVHSTVRDGRTVENEAYAVADAGQGHRSFEVNLATGEARDLGALPLAVTDLAIALNQR